MATDRPNVPPVDPVKRSAEFAAVLAEGLAIQHRFRPEPIYARTGVGFMLSEGVAPMQAAKEAARKAAQSGQK